MDMAISTDQAPTSDVKAVGTALVPTPIEPAAPPRKKVKRVKLSKLKRTKEVSSIAFPYMDLENAISVARAMIENGGLPFTREQLAGALRQSPTSGNFLLKTGAARQFGLAELVQGKFQLTALGFTIVGKDENKERAARAEAFLNVPLYRRAYEEFRGKQLPPRPHGLEQAFVGFGVATKQRATARQVFEKSARQAGFFNVDPDRLIEPILSPGATERPPEARQAETPSRFYGGEAAIRSAHAELDPLIEGLLSRLPKSGDKWEPEKRARWLQTLAANFDMVYTTDEGKLVVVEVKVINDPA